MKFRSPSMKTITGLGIYLLFGLSLTGLTGQGDMTQTQWASLVLSLALFLYTDLRSYSDGLRRGTEIANEVLNGLSETLESLRSVASARQEAKKNMEQQA